MLSHSSQITPPTVWKGRYISQRSSVCICLSLWNCLESSFVPWNAEIFSDEFTAFVLDFELLTVLFLRFTVCGAFGVRFFVCLFWLLLLLVLLVFCLFFLVPLTKKIYTPTWHSLGLRAVQEHMCEMNRKRWSTNVKIKSFLVTIKFYGAALFLCLLEVLFMQNQQQIKEIAGRCQYKQ